MSAQWHGGKGSRPRPLSVDTKTFDANWDNIFGKKKVDDNVIDAYNEERLVSKYDKAAIAKDGDQDIDPDNPDGDN